MQPATFDITIKYQDFDPYHRGMYTMTRDDATLETLIEVLESYKVESNVIVNEITIRTNPF